MPSDAPAGPYRVCVIEPRPLAAEAFRRLVAGCPDLVVEYTRTPPAGPGSEPCPGSWPDVLVFALTAGGVDALRALAADPAWGGVPVVAVSCHDDPQEKCDAFDAGAADFLVQYPDRLEVIARLKAHARRHRRAAR